MRSFLAAAAAAVLLTGCGTALAQPGAGHSGDGPRTAVVVNGSRAEAQAYVRHVMAELSLPAGSEPAHLTSLPQIARAQAPGAPGWAGASRILIVPGQPLAVLQRIMMARTGLGNEPSAPAASGWLAVGTVAAYAAAVVGVPHDGGS